MGGGNCHKALLAGGLIQTQKFEEVVRKKKEGHKALLAGGLIQTPFPKGIINKSRKSQSPFSGRSDSDGKEIQYFSSGAWSQSPFSGRSDSDVFRCQKRCIPLAVTKPF